jgi:type II secretory pathway component GspD/PulD (secretin)
MAARLLLVPVLAGTTAGVVSAQTPKLPKAPAAPQRAPAAATTDNPKDLLKMAKQALAAGQLDQAQDYVNKANQAAAAKGVKWGLFEDTPASVMKDIQQARTKADKMRAEQLFKEAKATYAKPAKSDAERMANLEQALTLAYQAKNLHGPYSLWDFGDKPDKLISQIETDKAKLRKTMPADAVARLPGKTPAAPTANRPTEAGSITATAMTPPKAPVGPRPTPPTTTVAGAKPSAANPAKADVMKLVADGRAALKQTKVVEARDKAMEARKLAEDKGLTTAFGPNEDSPEQLYKACMDQGREMIATLTKSAAEMTAKKEYDKAEAALVYAKELSDGLGFYTKPIDDQMAALAKMAGKTPPATATPVEVVQAPMSPDAPVAPASLAVPIVPPGPAVATLPPPSAPTMPAEPNTVASTPAEPAMSPMALTPTMPNPAVAAVPTPAPAGSVVPSVNLLDQAAAEMTRGDLEMARKMALEAHAAATDAAAKQQAQALLRQIEAEDFAVKKKNAKMAFENGVTLHANKRYENALGVFRLIDPAHLSADQKMQLVELMNDCVAKCGGPIDDGVKLTAVSEPPGVARVGEQPPASESLVDQQRALSDVAFQKLRQDGFDALNRANAAWGKGETDAALQILTDYAAAVRASSQSPSRQAMLLRPIEERAERFRLLKHHTDFLVNEAKEKADIRREMLAANVAESQKQEEIKRKVKQVNELTKAGKFKEAELAAAQAKQLDPDDPTLTYIAEQAKMRRRMEEFKGLRAAQEEFNLEQFNDVEKVGPPATMENPLIINPERARLAAGRGGADQTYLRPRTQTEIIIEQKLSTPFSFNFRNATLRDVLDDIKQKSGLNIVVDDAALEDEKISLDDKTITEEVKDLSLRDGLTILLSKARLAHVVENNVVKVTTEKRSKGRMTTQVFHVMDLVTPIPEYKPADYHRLDTAIASARGTTLPGALAAMAGSGGSILRDPSSGLQGGTMVSGGVGVPGSGSTPFLSGAGSLQNDLQSQPVAMSPQRSQYAAQLKKLVTSMVRPHTWEGLGGSGSIEYYDIGGALVVNQTADVILEVAQLLESLRRLQDLSVAVEVRVISLSEAFFERVGVDFAMNIKTHNTTFERMLATSQFRPEPFLNDIHNKNVLVGWNPATGGFTPDLDVPIRSTSFPLSIPPFGGYQGALGPTTNGGLAVGLAFLNDIQVYMFLEAAQGNRRVNVMQAPKITLFNGQTATVFVGDVAYFTTGLQVFNVGGQFVYLPQNIAFPVGSGFDPNTGQQGGVSVTVQAVISADRRFVRLNMSPTLTALASATVPLFPVTTFITPVFEGGSQGQPIPFTQFFQQPSFSEITAQTTVAVPDGGTVLLGGLKTLAQARNEFGPPVISHIPYLNRLFKNVGVGQETRHVMVMVTPRIIINSEEEARQVGEGGGLLMPQP